MTKLFVFLYLSITKFSNSLLNLATNFCRVLRVLASRTRNYVRLYAFWQPRRWGAEVLHQLYGQGSCRSTIAVTYTYLRTVSRRCCLCITCRPLLVGSCRPLQTGSKSSCRKRSDLKTMPISVTNCNSTKSAKSVWLYCLEHPRRARVDFIWSDLEKYTCTAQKIVLKIPKWICKTKIAIILLRNSLDPNFLKAQIVADVKTRRYSPFIGRGDYFLVKLWGKLGDRNSPCNLQYEFKKQENSVLYGGVIFLLE